VFLFKYMFRCIATYKVHDKMSQLVLAVSLPDQAVSPADKAVSAPEKRAYEKDLKQKRKDVENKIKDNSKLVEDTTNQLNAEADSLITETNDKIPRLLSYPWACCRVVTARLVNTTLDMVTNTVAGAIKKTIDHVDENNIKLMERAVKKRRLGP
jgi:hypothetical protein